MLTIRQRLDEKYFIICKKCFTRLSTHSNEKEIRKLFHALNNSNYMCFNCGSHEFQIMKIDEKGNPKRIFNLFNKIPKDEEFAKLLDEIIEKRR